MRVEAVSRVLPTLRHLGLPVEGNRTLITGLGEFLEADVRVTAGQQPRNGTRRILLSGGRFKRAKWVPMVFSGTLEPSRSIHGLSFYSLFINKRVTISFIND